MALCYHTHTQLFSLAELGAVTMRNRHVSDPTVIDGKMFLIGFMKLGFDARARVKSHTIEKQRKVGTSLHLYTFMSIQSSLKNAC